ncbi:MAG: hypothetical protein AAF571_07070 [Verrucomicrobiota bacterium]
MAKMGLDRSQFNKELAGAEGRFRQFASGVAGKLTAAFSTVAIVNFGKRTLETADRFGKLSQQFGVSAESLQRFDVVARLAGQDIEVLAKAMRTSVINSQEAAKGVKTYADAMEALNLDVETFKDLSPEQQLLEVADAVANASDQNLAYASAARLMGSRQSELIPLLRQGRTEIEAQMQSAAVMSEDMIQRAQAVNDMLLRLKNRLSVFFGEGILAGVQLVQVGLIKLLDLVKTTVKGLALVKLVPLEKALDLVNEIEAAQKRTAEFGKNPVAAGGSSLPATSAVQPSAAEGDSGKEEEAPAKRIAQLKEQVAQREQARLRSMMKTEEQINDVNKERMGLLKQYYATDDEEERLQIKLKMTDLLEREVDLASKLAQEHKEATGKRLDKEKEIAQVQQDAGKAALDLEKMKQDAQTQNLDRASVTLGDLASGKFGKGKQREAERINRLEERAKKAKVRGDFDKAEELLAKADGKRSELTGLSESERNPMKMTEEAIAQQTEIITTIQTELAGLKQAVQGTPT